MGGQRDHRNCAGARRRLDPARRLPAVDDRQAHVHQDQIGVLRGRRLDRLLAVERHDDLEALANEPPRQHVPVHLVVFHQQDLGHLFLGYSHAVGLVLGIHRRRRDAPADGLAEVVAGRLALGQHLRRAPGQHLLLLGRQVLGGQDHHRHSLERRPVPDRVEKREPVHLRHHQVEQDEGRRPVVLQPLQGLPAVRRLGGLEAELVEHAARRVARRLVVLDQQNGPLPATGQCWRSMAVRLARSTGLVMKSAAPRVSAMPRSLTIDTTTTGMSRSPGRP
jgi:hypothetical protein